MANSMNQIKCFLNSLTKNFLRFPLTRYFYQELSDLAMSINVPVRHGDIDMLFTSPNALTRYRSKSFSSKEPDTLIWLEAIPRDAVLWDVGANVGLYSIYAAKKSGAQVFAFEPSVFNLELLARNIFLNNLEQSITIIPIALNDSLSPSLFKMSTTTWGGALSTFGEDFDQYGGQLNSIFEYKTIGITMDHAISILKVPAPSFLKIDVDGIEHFILRGGAYVLSQVESVLIEISDDFTEQVEETAQHLQAAGLTLFRKCGGLNAGNQYNQWWVRIGSPQ